MLIVLRSDFSGLAGLRPPDADLKLPWLEIELDNGDLLKFDLGLEGVRNLEVECDGDDALCMSVDRGKLFLTFGAGNGGSVPAGGLAAGRDSSEVAWSWGENEGARACEADMTARRNQAIR
ncbi:hypothetical protein GB937_010355 [Aspergillus fischeri]|nr:hypothetical protein GB937_010355 [Aspergillus fischeri]